MVLLLPVPMKGALAFLPPSSHPPADQEVAQAQVAGRAGEIATGAGELEGIELELGMGQAFRSSSWWCLLLQKFIPICSESGQPQSLRVALYGCLSFTVGALPGSDLGARTTALSSFRLRKMAVMISDYSGTMLRLYFYLVTGTMLAVGVYGVVSNWRKDRSKVDEGMVVISIAVFGLLTIWAL